MIRRPPRSTLSSSSAASDVYKRQFHNRAAGLELAGCLGGIDHPNGDAILDRTTGVDVLHLGQHGAGNSVRDRVELDQGCVPDEVGDILGILHPAMLSDSEQIPGTTPPTLRTRAQKPSPRRWRSTRTTMGTAGSRR